MTDKKNIPSLALGTVQFGLPYGITNTGGQVAQKDASIILEKARMINTEMVIDTAPAYGNSGEIIGKILKGKNFKIVTKTNLKNPDIHSSLKKSLDSLDQTSVYGLLDHNAHFLQGPKGTKAYNDMSRLKSDGLAKKIGASVYNADDIDRVMAIGEIDIFQIPMNVFDQRLIESGHIKKIKDRGIEIHVRSVFLQGLLLAEPHEIPNTLSSHRHMFEQFHRACSEYGITALQGALAFLRTRPEIDHIIVGVTSTRQFEEIIKAASLPIPNIQWDQFSCTDPLLLNPANWQKAS